MEIYLELLGAHPAQVALKGLEERILNFEPAFGAFMGILEAGEQRIFDAWNGKYVKTRALLNSLTQPDADGALRRVHHGQADFGTLIPYAVYQRDQGRSAIMRFDDTEIAEIEAEALSWIAGPLL